MAVMITDPILKNYIARVFYRVALHANNVDIFLDFISILDIDTGNWNTPSRK